MTSNVLVAGATGFGVVLGWSLYMTLRHAKEHGAKDISVIASAIGGAAITKIFPDKLFGYYCIGLFGGFAAYFLVGLIAALAMPKRSENLKLFFFGDKKDPFMFS